MTDFVTPDVRDGIPLSSRRAESLMPFSIGHRREPVAAYPSLVAAGADIPEADTAQRVAADPSVIDAERHPLYSDGVQHSTNLKSEGDRDQLGCESVLHSSYSRSVRADQRLADAGSEAAEALRVSRLSRWQEQR